MKSIAKKSKPTRKERLLALHKESARLEREQILDRLALPMNQRTHFLRLRFGARGSSL